MRRSLLHIIHEDPEILVIDKPAGLLTSTVPREKRPTGRVCEGGEGEAEGVLHGLFTVWLINWVVKCMDRLSVIFGALADGTRRGMLARLAEGEASVTELARPYLGEMSLPAVTKHLKVLERAGLISRTRNAQWRPCRLEPAPLKDVASWVAEYQRFWDESFDRLDAYLQELLRAGVAGYVLKQSEPHELLAAIRAAAAGKQYLDSTLTARVTAAFLERDGKRTGKAVGTLSDREAEVLRLIASGYSNKEIASRLELSVKTVEAHKANAMRKLDLNGRIDIVKYALMQGWLDRQ